MSAICVVYSNLKDSSCPKNGINSLIFSCDSTSMNLIQFLAMTIHQGPAFIDGMVNSTEVVVQDEFREGRPKSVVVPETIYTVRQLILQDRHVIYREIETTLCISGTRIHSILHEYFTVKKNCSRWIKHNLPIAQKNQSIRVTKVVRQLVQKHVKVYRSWDMENILKNNKAIFDD